MRPIGPGSADWQRIADRFYQSATTERQAGKLKDAERHILTAVTAARWAEEASHEEISR